MLAATTLALLACAGLAASASAADYVRFSSFGAFGYPQAIAADATTGHVYVADGSSVLRFTAGGDPADFSSTGTNALDVSGLPGEQGTFFAPVSIAVDRSGGATDGDIYVADSGTPVIDVFGQNGAYKGQLTGSGAPGGFTYVCGVAVDPAGDVYVGDYDGTLNRFDPSASPVADADHDGQIVTGTTGVCHLAADSTGAAYTAAYGAPGVTRYAASEFGAATPSGTVVDPNGTSVAVDPTDDAVYANSGTQVTKYDAAGALLTTFGDGQIGSSPALAVDGAKDQVYVLDTSAGQVHVYGVPIPAAPLVAGGTATDVTPTTATLEAEVDPHAAETTYRFEYGTDDSYGQSAPVPDAALGSGYGLQPVSQPLTGLQPGTTYHYRVVATNSFDTVEGDDRTFTTAPAGAVTATAVGAVGATVHGTVNPHGAPATYRFEYGVDSSYGQSTREADGGSATIDVPVTARLGRLSPATTYHVRLVTTTAAGAVASDDATFTTLAAPTAATAAPTAVGPSSATLHGTVDPHGVDGGSYQFLVQSLTSPHRSQTAVTAVPDAGRPHDVAAVVTGLPAGQTFTAQVAITSAGTTVYGEEITFSTSPEPPLDPGPPPSTRVPQYGCLAPRLDPVQGRVKPGAALTITGSDLGSWGDVRIGADDADVTSWSPTAIRLTVPAGARGQLSVTVNCGRPAGAVRLSIAAPPSNRVTTKAKVTGRRARLTVTVPGPGRLTVRGSGLTRAGATVKRKGAVTVTVSLSDAGARALKQARGKRISRPATVTFTPAGGSRAATKVPLTFVRR